MSTVSGLCTGRHGTVVRWSPMPMSWYKLNYLGVIDGKPAVMIFDPDARRELNDPVLWNLFYAFHASHEGKTEENELAVSGFNPRTKELLPLADARVDGKAVREWMSLLKAAECVALLTEELELPFPGTRDELKQRGLMRVAHLRNVQV